ncbi:AfsR/SARP family transcriptional regulator [Nonomuraea jiangxiensis]|uniref:DNA-binding transcriptional activator of the SARP family n=1 Tax=Nonomuraea jiangxiensis TaxID=633440 RepID=A0A1G8TQE5_9ACTN|nr:BTAD domain-containing putative transcriptional regulator [Nonomuraea jiangxiensis]SDJ43752.1 DNA-binding transcriptional activator of the SARP family [Nonomuraea jiangxiensis]
MRYVGRVIKQPEELLNGFAPEGVVRGKAVDEVEFRLLGPVGVWSGGEPLGPATAQQRSVLTMLLIEAGRVVSVDRLELAVWGQETPPATARNTIQGCVSQIRRILSGATGISLATVPPGYRLDVDPMKVDLFRFRDLVRQAATADLTEARDLLGRALDLWSGPALADVAGLWLHGAIGAVLEEERLAAMEERLAISLRTGRHREVLAEVPMLMSEHPLRERPAYLMMAALHQDGRRAAALEVFREVRELLVEELGIEPGDALQDLHRRILQAEAAVVDPAAAMTPVTVPVPAELPARPGKFAGRVEEFASAHELLRGDGSGVMKICQISGIGGIGKSSLAIHVAHAVAELFPDGQLYVDLHGSTPQMEPIEPIEALGRFLRSLGVADSAVPTDAEEAAGRFRSLVHGKRMLIVLDNARDTAQVRLLLPGSPTCAVLITSRRRLTSFEDALQIPLDVLAVEEGLALLSDLLGADRIAGDRIAAAEIVRLCGGLPLALCLAAARLSTRPSWPVAELAERLAADQGGLDVLEADDRAVRASFEGSYRDLREGRHGPAAARMFRLLGLIDVADLGPPVAAALADLPVEQARDLLDHLVDAQLVQNHTRDRYRLHDLLRLYARERAIAEEPEPVRQEAVRRVMHCYLETARRATGLLKVRGSWRVDLGPQSLSRPAAVPETAEQMQEWVTTEEDNVLALIARTARTSAAGLAIALAATFAPLLFERGRWLKLLPLGELGLRAAEHTQDPLHQALICGDLGWARFCLGDTNGAITHLHRALEGYRRIGGHHREAAVLDHIGIAYRSIGRLDEAIEHQLRALRLARANGDRWQEGANLSNLGLTYQHAGRISAAIDAHTRSIALLEEAGAAADGVTALGNLAEAYRLGGEYEQAMACHRRALRTLRDNGQSDDYRTAEISWGLGLALHETGEAAEARRHWRASAAILHALGLITAEDRRAIDTSALPATPEVIRRHT